MSDRDEAMNLFDSTALAARVARAARSARREMSVRETASAGIGLARRSARPIKGGLAAGQLPAAAREQLLATARSRSRHMVSVSRETVSSIEDLVGPDRVDEYVEEAARQALQREALSRIVDEMQAEHGAPTDEELAAVDEALGL